MVTAATSSQALVPTQPAALTTPKAGEQCLEYVERSFPQYKIPPQGNAANFVSNVEAGKLPGLQAYRITGNNNAAASGRLPTTTPQPGDILAFGTGKGIGSDGHVAIVTAVNGNQITVRQANFPNSDSNGNYTYTLNGPHGSDQQIVGIIRPSTPAPVPMASPALTMPSTTMPVSTLATIVPTSTLKTVATNVTQLGQIGTQVAALKSDMNVKGIANVAQDIKSTQQAVGTFIESKMPSTDSWLYKNTNFVDSAAAQKLAKPAQTALSEVGKIAPTASTTGTLVRDIAGLQVDKVPADIVKSQAAMTDYFTQKMPNTNSVLYKATGFVDNPTVQKVAKFDQAALSEVGKIAPTVSTAGTLARDVAGFQVDKLPQDIVKSQAAMTDYLTKKMPSTDSWLYKNTNFMDNPTVQKIAKVDQAALAEVGKIAPVSTSAGSVARDVATLQVTKLPQDIVDTRQAMTTYFTDKMPSTNSWLYKATNVLDTPIVQKFVKTDEAMLNSVAKLAPAANKVTAFMDNMKSLGGFF